MSRFSGRSLDKLWFAFFAFHLPISILLDLQYLYPPSLIPSSLKSFMLWSINLTRDPILLGAVNNDPTFGWLKCFSWLEAGFQVPCFVAGLWGLWNNDKRVYPVILAYGASTATTLLPCLHTIFTTQATPPHTTAEIANLLAEYVPFLLLPLGMAVDMSWRIVKIINAAEEKKNV
ncbi:hypothetical protein LQV05_004788 [Cryptococcus neoformans]|nr:hypothetical protein C356_03829 [Cryptococcus neoformans var. grubii c45]OXB36463.1 hypothetical protein J007_03773 [Cryptococcus neoformans var. grubii]OXC60660.1 hypothetical protein C358_03867 [Cryptococcus neoformans var. grubii MW-RSA852]UOH82099.1 hypothetical protein LQV05_004788 [Cryptococcus neoformans]